MTGTLSYRHLLAVSLTSLLEDCRYPKLTATMQAGGARVGGGGGGWTWCGCWYGRVSVPSRVFGRPVDGGQFGLVDTGLREQNRFPSEKINVDSSTDRKMFDTQKSMLSTKLVNIFEKKSHIAPTISNFREINFSLLQYVILYAESMNCDFAMILYAV